MTHISKVPPLLNLNEGIFNAIISDIDKKNKTDIPQPIVLIGGDGSGKSTLLRQIYKLVRQSDIPAVWIDGRSIFSIRDIINHPEISKDTIIFIDDIDFFFTRCSYNEQYILRSVLYNEHAPMLISSAEKILPAFSEYQAPFFEGLKFLYIPPISLDNQPLDSLFTNKEEKIRAKAILALLPSTIRSVIIAHNIIQQNDDPTFDIKRLISEFYYQYKHLYQSLPTYSQHILSVIGNSPAPGLPLSEIRKRTNLPTSVLSIYLRNLQTSGILSIDKTIKNGYKYMVKDPLFGEWLSLNSL